MTARVRRARASLLALMGAGALVLSACGGSTVESSEVTETTSAAAGSSGTSESATSAPSSSKETSRTSARKSQERDITEPGAARASSAPDGRMPLSRNDEDYLDALIADGIDVEGTEDQLIAAGHVHCGTGADDGAADAAVVDAVAGQIVAQERTKKDEPAVAQSIAKAAESAYC